MLGKLAGVSIWLKQSMEELCVCDQIGTEGRTAGLAKDGLEAGMTIRRL